MFTERQAGKNTFPYCLMVGDSGAALPDIDRTSPAGRTTEFGKIGTALAENCMGQRPGVFVLLPKCRRSDQTIFAVVSCAFSLLQSAV
jgi:hypothetical protein